MTQTEVLKAIAEKKRLYYYDIDPAFKIREVRSVRSIDLKFEQILFGRYDETVKIKFERLFSSREELAQSVRDALYVQVGDER